MLRLPRFQFRVPSSLEEAAKVLASEGPSTRLVAGGTDLWPNMKRRHQMADTVVSLMAIPGLRGVANGQANGSDLRLGATAILGDIAANPLVRERYPALARAVASISSPPLRNMGTIGGNLCVDTRCTYYNQTEEWRRSIDYCMKEAGEICWVAPSSPSCWAHTASDSAPVLCALGASVKLVSAEGDRTVAAPDLFANDGIEYLTKQPDEILTDIYLPAASTSESCRSSFWKLRRRGSIDFAVLSVAAAVWTDPSGVVERAEIYFGAVASRPTAARDAADFLVGKRLDEETVREAARMARKVATPMDNTDFQAQWRGTMAERYTLAALREAAGRDPGFAPPKHFLA